MALWKRMQLEGGGSSLVLVERFRLMCFQRPLAPWRATLEEANLDALDQHVATRERGVVWLTVPAWIRQSECTAETEAGLRQRRGRRLVEVANAGEIPLERRA